MKKYRLLLCEDTPELLADYVGLLHAHERMEVVAAVANGTEAIACLAREPIDVLVIDLGLPDVSGLEVISVMRRLQPACEALVVTVFGDESSVVQAIARGATGYVLKRELAFNLVRRIEELLEGGSPITPAVARLLLNSINTIQHKDTADVTDELARAATAIHAADASESESTDARLSEREIEVLRLVAKGFSVQEVGDMLSLSGNTVKTYVRRIYKKLSVNSRTEAVYEARIMGILDSAVDPALRLRPIS